MAMSDVLVNFIVKELAVFSFTYPLTMGVVGAAQMTLQPVSSIFLCSPLPSWTWQTPCLSIPWRCLPPLFLSTLSSSPFQCALQDILARPDEWETRPYHCSLRLFTMVRSWCGPIACWILAQTETVPRISSKTTKTSSFQFVDKALLLPFFWQRPSDNNAEQHCHWWWSCTVTMKERTRLTVTFPVFHQKGYELSMVKHASQDPQKRTFCIGQISSHSESGGMFQDSGTPC